MPADHPPTPLPPVHPPLWPSPPHRSITLHSSLLPPATPPATRFQFLKWLSYILEYNTTTHLPSHLSVFSAGNPKWLMVSPSPLPDIESLENSSSEKIFLFHAHLVSGPDTCLSTCQIETSDKPSKCHLIIKAKQIKGTINNLRWRD